MKNRGCKPPHRWVETLNSIAIFLILVVTYSYVLPRWSDMNQNSRIDMVMAIVDHGTFQIDRYVANTTDYAKYNGHYYSDKAPGSALLGVPIYTTLKLVMDQPLTRSFMQRLSSSDAFMETLREDGSGVYEAKIDFAITQVILTFFLAVIPSALIGVMIYRLLSAFTLNGFPRILVALTYGVLTPAYTYAGQFYGHQLAAAFAFGAFYLLFQPNSQFSRAKLTLVGVSLGMSVVTEYPLILAAGILFLYAGYRLWKNHLFPRIIYVAIPSVLLAAGLLSYNNAVFGSPFSLGYGYSELWESQHSVGYMSLTVPHFDAVWGITFSLYRGIFLLSPVLLLGIPGFLLWFRQKTFRAEAITVSAITASLFIFNASSVMWWGGFSVGPRYLYPALPFYAILLLFPILAWGKSTWFKILYGICAVSSFIMTWGLSLAGQSFPPDTLKNPIIEYAIPNLTAGNIARSVGILLGLPHWWSLVLLLLLWIAFIGLWIYGVYRIQTISERRLQMIPSALADQGKQGDQNIG